MRYIRDFRFCTGKAEWVYRLGGKGYRGSERWVGEGGLRKVDGGGRGG